MDSWEKCDENTMKIPSKEDFHNELNLENIADKDYEHAQKVRDVFRIKNLGESHDLYVQIDTLLLADLYENLYMKLILYILFLLQISMTSLFKKDRSKIRVNNRLRCAING